MWVGDLLQPSISCVHSVTVAEGERRSESSPWWGELNAAHLWRSKGFFLYGTWGVDGLSRREAAVNNLKISTHASIFTSMLGLALIPLTMNDGSSHPQQVLGPSRLRKPLPPEVQLVDIEQLHI